MTQAFVDFIATPFGFWSTIVLFVLIGIRYVVHLYVLWEKVSRAKEATDHIIKRGGFVKVENTISGHSVEPKFPPRCPNCGFHFDKPLPPEQKSVPREPG